MTSDKEKLIAKFIKVVNDDGSFDEDNSYWIVVTADGKIVLNNIVSDIKRQYGITYSELHCIDFGRHLIFKAKSMRAFW